MRQALVNANPLRRCLAVVALTVLVVLPVGACGESEKVLRGGASVLPTVTVGPVLTVEPTPTYDPHEHNLTPTLMPPPEDLGTPSPLSTPDPSAPYSRQILVTYGPSPSVAQVVQQYGVWVTGRVVELLPAQWTTPDSQRPADPYAVNVREIFIITPVVIELDSSPLVNRYGADLSTGRIVVAAFGGQVGQDSVATTDSAQHLRVGERVLLGLTTYLYLNGDVERQFQTPAGLAWNVGTKYRLTEDGLAVPPNPTEQPLPAAELIAQIVAAGTSP